MEIAVCHIAVHSSIVRAPTTTTNAATMTITYEEALETLSSMFSDYTSQQLDAVLRHHGGHMENTVETLLSHTGSPDDLIAKVKRGEIPTGGPAAGVGAGIDADEEIARQLEREYRSQQQQRSPGAGGRGFVPPGQRRVMASNVTAPPAAARTSTTQPRQPMKTGRGTLTTLPNDFLRIPGRKYPQTAQEATASTGGGLTDEQLARMLQDELFQEELRWVSFFFGECSLSLVVWYSS